MIVLGLLAGGVSFILPQRSLIAGRLASTDRNTSNTPGSTAICDPTAISSFVVLSPLSCVMLLANSTTAEEITLLEYSSHARTSGSCMAVSRSAECLRNVSHGGSQVSLLLLSMMAPNFKNTEDHAHYSLFAHCSVRPQEFGKSTPLHVITLTSADFMCLHKLLTFVLT